MPTKKKSFLLTLPVELVHRIFDYVDTETIIFVIRCVCKQLYALANVYDRYELDFRYMFRSDLPLMARIINPKNVTSLTLSNELHTSNQINFFLSQFPIERFIRLHSLTLVNVEKELKVFQKLIAQCPLRKFSILLEFNDINNLQTWLSSIVANIYLRKLEFSASSWLLHDIQWPTECRLEHLTIFHQCSWNTIKLILTHLPCLRILVLKDVQLFDLRETTITEYNTLTSLSLNSSELEIQKVETLLSFFPKLEHLQLINDKDFSDPALFDGSRLENFIETKLPLLNKFEFRFSNYVQFNSNDITVETLIASFQSLFWLEVKHWIIKCDSEYKEHLEVFHLYSIPICRNDFDYSSQHRKIQCSALNTNVNNNIIMVNSNHLSIDLSEMIIESIQQKVNIRTNYLFENVTELEFIVLKKWPIGSIEQLLRMLSLSKLQTLRLYFIFQCEFTSTMTTEVCNLINQAKNLRSIEIGCNDLVTIMPKTLSTIWSKLPNHIRRLKIDIANVKEGKQILERAEHLSSITFRPYKRSYLNHELIESISKMGNYVQYKLQPDMLDESVDPENDCTIHLWLGRNMTKQNIVLTHEKRGKRIRNCVQS